MSLKSLKCKSHRLPCNADMAEGDFFTFELEANDRPSLGSRHESQLLMGYRAATLRPGKPQNS